MLSLFILLVRKSGNMKSLLPMKWRLSQQAFTTKHWQSQTFETILPRWWCNPLTIFICKLVILLKVCFLLEGSRRRQDNETTTDAEMIRNWRMRNTLPHHRYYLSCDVCRAWICFLTNTLSSNQTVPDTPGSCICTPWTCRTGRSETQS